MKDLCLLYHSMFCLPVENDWMANKGQKQEFNWESKKKEVNVHITWLLCVRRLYLYC